MPEDRMGTAASRQIAERLAETPKLSVERLPVLHGIFERLATSCTEGLRQMFAPPTTFFVNQVETGNSWDILESYEDSVGAIFYSPEWDARILIGLDKRFVFSAVEAIYGGDGTEVPFEGDRPFSLLETRMAKDICEIAASSLQASFESVSAITLKFERVEARIDFSTLGQRNTPTVVAQMLFQVFDNGGRMFILIPQPALFPIRKKLEQEYSPDTTSNDPRWTQQLQTSVAQTEVTLHAVLEGRTMTLYELATLRVGQIVDLRATTESLVTLESAEEALFRCRLGQAKGFFTVLTESSVDQAQEFIGEILAGSTKL